MKKLLRAMTLLTVCCYVMTISGCGSDDGFEPDPVSDPDTGYELVPVSEIRESFPRITEELRAGGFENLSFSKTEFSFPEIDSISELSLSPPSGKSPREMYDFYCDSLEALLPGVFSEEEKLNGMLFSDDNRDPYADFLPIDEYEAVAEGGSPLMLFMDNNKCFMQGLFSTLEWYVSDDLNRWNGVERAPFLGSLGNDFTYETHTVDYVTDLNSTDKYELINGEMSIKDAAEFVTDFLETTVFSPYEQDAKTKLLAVDVVDIGGGKYGYGFLTVYEYNGVLFDYPEMNEVNRRRGILNDYDDREYSHEQGEVSMVQTDKVLHFIVPVLGYSIEETETYTSIITLQDAAGIISDFYSKYMSFSVTRVEAVYLEYERTAIPCWKFVMRCSGEVYNTFVDMQTGEVHLYIQAGN